MVQVARNTLLVLISCSLLTSAVQGQDGRNIDFSAISQLAVWSPDQQANVNIGSSGKLELLVLMSPECPMSVNYTLTLNQLQEAYSEQLRITGLIPGSAYNDDTVRAFARSYKLLFPLLTDRKQELTRQLHGEVTPEVFLFNQEGRLIYTGAIDNWMATLGKKKQKADQFYLADAIRQAINGDPVAIAYVKAQGCSLNEY